MGEVVRFLGYDPFPEGITIGERIAHFRKSQGITQTALAAKVGVDPGTLSRWETGDREPKGAYLKALTRHLTSLSETPSLQTFD
jgi:transcriptional regulator with XRE-family HTH domain